MKPFRSIISEHRVSRLSAWARLALVWIGQVLFSLTARPNRRHVRRRYQLLDLDFMARLVAHLVLARAAQIGRLRRRQPRQRRNFAAPGFRRRLIPRQVRRAAIGSRLRRHLRARDLGVRFTRIAEALANLDSYARVLWRRLRAGLTRLAPLIPTHPPAERLASLVFATPAADTS